MTTERPETTRPLRLFRINAGSCNGCDVELTATACLSRFAVERAGFVLTEEPAEADIVLVTGPLTARVKRHVLDLHAQVPEPKVTVAVGICPISGGVFRESYAVDAPLERYLPVQVNVPGCPPRPQAIVEGLRAAATLFRGDVLSPRQESAADAALPIRGKLHHDAAACCGCRMCEHVCAGGAISFSEDEEGLAFALDHATCAFCGMCAHFCKTGALTHSSDWHTAHYATEKAHLVRRSTIPNRPCAVCGELLVPVPVELIRLAYRGVNPHLSRLQNLCPECRQKESLFSGAKR